MVVSDHDGKAVLHVADCRSQESLGAYYDTLLEEQEMTIESVSMDIWPCLYQRGAIKYYRC